MTPQLTFILGCTACGKSAVGFELARQCGAEIVSVDSMKIYRRLDIGTAKPAPQQQATVPYHMIDVVEPAQEFNVARYCAQAEEIIHDLHQRGVTPLCVGGTALYVRALSEGLFEGPGEDPAFRERLREEAQRVGSEALHKRLRGIDPQAADRIHSNDYRRIERALEVYELGGVPISVLQTQWNSQALKYDCRFVGLRREKEDQSRRINQRVKRMMEQGLLQEVQALVDEQVPLSKQAAQAVGYAELLAHLRGEMTLEEASEQIKINSRRLAKSQRTWFRRFPTVSWFDLKSDEPVEAVVARIKTWYDSQP